VSTRTVEEIDADLNAYSVRRRDTLDRVITSMFMLNAIDHRVEKLLDERARATAMAAHPSARA
jgi:hypothetical protein